jgi:hypothetical protein
MLVLLRLKVLLLHMPLRIREGPGRLRTVHNFEISDDDFDDDSETKSTRNGRLANSNMSEEVHKQTKTRLWGWLDMFTERAAARPAS